MTDLDRLIKAVETGERGGAVWLDLTLGPINGYRGLRAYRGSLDAALSLMESLLPGWIWDVGIYMDTSPKYSTSVTQIADGRPVACQVADSDNPARALLLAVLKAYKKTRDE